MDSESRRAFLLVSLGFALFGCLFFVIGIILFRRERAFARRAVSAQGVVIGFQRRRTASRYRGRSSSLYRDQPIVRYTTREGQDVQFESPFGTSPRVHAEGQKVEVLYGPANPVAARLASGWMRYGLPLVFIGLGLGMLLFATLFALLAWFLIEQIPAVLAAATATSTRSAMMIAG